MPRLFAYYINYQLPSIFGSVFIFVLMKFHNWSDRTYHHTSRWSCTSCFGNRSDRASWTQLFWTFRQISCNLSLSLSKRMAKAHFFGSYLLCLHILADSSVCSGVSPLENSCANCEEKMVLHSANDPVGVTVHGLHLSPFNCDWLFCYLSPCIYENILNHIPFIKYAWQQSVVLREM